MPKCRIPSGPVFCDALRQVATVVVETTQLVLNHFNWELNKVYPYQNN